MIMRHRYFYLCLLFVTSLHSQFYISSPTELATSGAFLGGRLGTHALHSNPALLGIKTGDLIESSLIDTFNLSYSLKLATSDNKTDLEKIRDSLIKDKNNREYKIYKKDSVFILKSIGFKNSIEAYNYSTELPIEVPLKVITSDTTWKTFEKPVIKYRIKLFSTTNKDTINFYKKILNTKLKDYKTYVIRADSLYQYYLEVSDSEDEAIMLKNSPKIQSIFKNPSVDFFYNSIPEGFSPKLSITFPLRFSIGFNNNSINTNWFNKYISANMVEDPSIKDNFIKSLPASGLSGAINASTSALELTYQNFGISLFNIHTFYNINIPKELSEIVFDGITFEEPKDISNFDTRGLAYNETVFSYGKKVNFKKVPFNTYLGFGFRYYSGFFSYTDSFEGVVGTKQDSIKIYSNINIISSNPNNMASGFGLDLGIYSKINEKISAQFSLIGLGSSLKSKKVDNIKNISNISISNIDINKIIDFTDSQSDSITKTFSILDTVEIVKNVSIDLPARLNIATSYIYSPNIHIKAAFQHIMGTSFIGIRKPEISIGTEIYPNKPFSLLTGASFGGINKITFGAGFGLNIKSLCFNFSINQYGGVFNYAKGFNIASEFRIVI